MLTKQKPSWYVAGLHFECLRCGRCCAGPGAGYIWVTRGEIKLIADFLKITTAELRHKFLKRVVLRTTVIEQPSTRDCIFLQKSNGQTNCMIYSVRPNQCRTWPFWSENLKTPDTWNQTAQKCPGVNRERFYSFDEIEIIRKK